MTGGPGTSLEKRPLWQAAAATFLAVTLHVAWPGLILLQRAQLPAGELAHRRGRLWLAALITGALCAAFISCVAALLHTLGSGELFHDAAVERPASAAKRGEQRLWFAGGLVVVALALVIVERVEPYYFVQDDNFSQFLPVVLHAYRALEQGIIPTWNPHQFLGSPTTTTGIYSITYPPLYLSYWFATHVLHDSNSTYELYAAIHLFAGYVAAFVAARRLGIRPPLAAAAALACALNGYELVAGRSWLYMIPLCVYLPLAFDSIAVLRQRGPSLRWVTTTGVALGLFLHVGNVQMWIYAVMFMALAVAILVATREMTVRRALWLGPPLLVAMGLAAPLLVPQVRLLGGVARLPIGSGIADGIAALFLPAPLVFAQLPDASGLLRDAQFAPLFYSGSLFVLAGLAVLLGVIAYRISAPAAAANFWLPCAGVAFVLALGDQGVLWTWMCDLPLFEKFSRPHKFLPLLTTLLAFGGGLSLDRLLSARVRAGVVPAGLAIGVALLLLWNASQARLGFFPFPDRPYPPVPQAMRSMTGTNERPPQGRVLILGHDRTLLPGFASTFALNFATVYGALAVEGYDDILESRLPETLTARMLMHAAPVHFAKAFGVRWLLLHDPAPDGVPDLGYRDGRPAPNGRSTTALLRREEDEHTYDELAVVSRYLGPMGLLRVWQLPEPDPIVSLATAGTAARRPLPYVLRADGLDIDLGGGPGGEVLIGFVDRPEMRLALDGTALAHSHDQWGRMTATAGRGKKLTVRYAPAVLPGVVTGAVCLLLAAGISLVLTAKARGG